MKGGFKSARNGGGLSGMMFLNRHSQAQNLTRSLLYGIQFHSDQGFRWQIYMRLDGSIRAGRQAETFD
jgi:hypothetical protein